MQGWAASENLGGQKLNGAADTSFSLSMLFLSEGGHWMQPGGSTSRNQAGQESCKPECRRYACEYRCIEGTDTVYQAGHQPGQGICSGDSCCQAGQGRNHAVA